MDKNNRGRRRGRGRNVIKIAASVPAATDQPNHVIAPVNHSGEEDSEPERVGGAQMAQVWIINGASVRHQHRLLMHAAGTRGDNSNRRKIDCCRHCPSYDAITGKRKRDRMTVYFCDVCKIALHPECHLPFHEGLGGDSGCGPSHIVAPVNHSGEDDSSSDHHSEPERVGGAQMAPVWHQHKLLMHAVGTRGDNSNRRKNGCCKYCPSYDAITGKRKRDRMTVYFCDV
jgi:hypothetical protein